MTQGSVSTVPAGRRLFDIINVPLLAIVAICFFLPLAELNCGPIKAKFSGTNLAFGTDPAIEGIPTEQMQGPGNREKFPTNPILLLIPLCAVVGAVLSWLAFKGTLSLTFARLLPVLSGILVVLFLYFTIFGFGIEQDLARQQKMGRDEARQATIDKTGAFYTGFVASAAALALTLRRSSSPLVKTPSTHSVPTG